MIFSDVLELLGNAVGLADVALDGEGSCTLLFDGEHEVTFTYDRRNRTVFLHSEVGEASSLDREACMSLLQASLLGAETDGGALSVHAATDTVVLWKRYDDTFPDLSALEQAVNDFLAQVACWKEKLVSGGAESSASVPDGSPDTFAGFGMFA